MDQPNFMYGQPVPDDLDTVFEAIQVVESTERRSKANVQVYITEQPHRLGVRYRYESEVRASPLHGSSSTDSHKTFTTIELRGPDVVRVLDYTVVVSCVSHNPPFFPHPHNIYDESNRHVYNKITNGNGPTEFRTIGIQCVKKKDIAQSMAIRQQMNIDPFKTGFPKNHVYNMSVVRLCFQVFVRMQDCGDLIPLVPKLSNPVPDKRTNDHLVIKRMSHVSGSVRGDQMIILLCDRVKKDDIAVQFFQTDGNSEHDAILWSAFAKFQESDVHHQYAIVLRSPAYGHPETMENVCCWVRLQKKKNLHGDQPLASSEARRYEYIAEPPINEMKRKRVVHSSDYINQLSTLPTFDSTFYKDAQQ